MATSNITINDQVVTIMDVEDVGYVAPTTGSVIHLTTREARDFVHTELVQVKDRREDSRLSRISNEDGKLKSNAQRDGYVIARDIDQANMDADDILIADLRVYLQSEGDTTA